MKKDLILFVVFLVYLFFLTRISFDLLVQGSIVCGFSIGFHYVYLFRQRNLLWNLFSLFLFPFLAIIIAFSLRDLPYSSRSFLITTLIFYVITLLGYGFSRVPLKSSYKHSVWLGILVLFLSAASRKLGHGTSAVITVVLSSLSAYNITLQTQEKRKLDLVFFVLVFPIGHLILTSFPEIFQMAILAFTIAVVSVIVFNLVKISDSKMSQIVKVGFVIVVFGLPIWFIQENYEKWFFSKLTNSIPMAKAPYTVVTSTGDSLSDVNMGDKQLVFLFWSAYCSNCPDEYPYFSQLAEKQNDRSDIKCVAVFLSLREKDSVYYNEVVKEKFSFIWAKALNSEKLMNDLEIQGAPHLTIFGKNNDIKYNGVVCNRPWLWVNKPEDFLIKY